MAVSTAYEQETQNEQQTGQQGNPSVRGRKQNQGEPKHIDAWFDGIDGMQMIGLGVMVGALCLSGAVIFKTITDNGNGHVGRRNRW